MATRRQERVAELIKRLAAAFINEESTRQSLITVTKCNVSPDLRKATIYVTVFPEESEPYALHFLRRKRNDLRSYLKEHTKIKIIPFVDVEIDKGEKNRQKIDELIKKK